MSFFWNNCTLCVFEKIKYLIFRLLKILMIFEKQKFGSIFDSFIELAQSTGP